MINFQVNVFVRMDCMLEIFPPFQPGKSKQGLKMDLGAQHEKFFSVRHVKSVIILKLWKLMLFIS